MTRLPMLLVAACLAWPAAAAGPGNRVAPPEPVAASGDGPLRLSVEEAVALALQYNPALLAERQQPIAAGAFEAIERARFDPALFAGIERGGEVTQEAFANTNENILVERDVESARLGLRQTLPTGTELELTLSQDRFESDRTPTQSGARAGLTVTQALLRGAGIASNLVALRQARTDTLASAYQLRGFVATLVADVERTYWAYLGARERIRILETSLELAERQVEETRQRIAAGALAETELAAVRAEAAQRRQDLIDGRAEAAGLRTELLRLINPPGEADYDRAVEPSSAVLVEPSPVETAADHVTLALDRRPELNEARLLLARNELEVVATRNGLLPRLDLFVTLGGTGFAESYGDAWRRVEDTDTYDLAAALEFEYPLGNRAARAGERRAVADRTAAEAGLVNLERLVSAEVRAAVLEVARAAAQIAASGVTRELREQALAAERTRFEVGRSTGLLVAQAQRDLLEARLGEADAYIAYRQARIDLYRLDGSLLVRRMIEAPGDGPPQLGWARQGNK